MVQYRFIIPAIPFLSIAIVFSLREFMLSKRIKSPVKYIILIAFLLLTIHSIIAEDKFIIQKETIMWNKLKDFSGDMKNDIPAGSLVANGSSGIIPYYLDNVVFLDIVGLTNKTIAKNGFRHGSWFEKSLPEYVYSKNPGWLIMWKKKNKNGIYTFEDASPGYADMANDDNFKKYSFYKSYDVYEDVRVELYKIRETAN